MYCEGKVLVLKWTQEVELGSTGRAGGSSTGQVTVELHRNPLHSQAWVWSRSWGCVAPFTHVSNAAFQSWAWLLMGEAQKKWLLQTVGSTRATLGTPVQEDLGVCETFIDWRLQCQFS